ASHGKSLLGHRHPRKSPIHKAGPVGFELAAVGFVVRPAFKGKHAPRRARQASGRTCVWPLPKLAVRAAQSRSRQKSTAQKAPGTIFRGWVAFGIPPHKG